VVAEHELRLRDREVTAWQSTEGELTARVPPVTLKPTLERAEATESPVDDSRPDGDA